MHTWPAFHSVSGEDAEANSPCVLKDAFFIQETASQTQTLQSKFSKYTKEPWFLGSSDQVLDLLLSRWMRSMTEKTGGVVPAAVWRTPSLCLSFCHQIHSDPQRRSLLCFLVAILQCEFSAQCSSKEVRHTDSCTELVVSLTNSTFSKYRSISDNSNVRNSTFT